MVVASTLFGVATGVDQLNWTRFGGQPNHFISTMILFLVNFIGALGVGMFTLESETKEPSKSSDPIGWVQKYGPKEFALGSRFKVQSCTNVALLSCQISSVPTKKQILVVWQTILKLGSNIEYENKIHLRGDWGPSAVDYVRGERRVDDKLLSQHTSSTSLSPNMGYNWVACGCRF